MGPDGVFQSHERGHRVTALPKNSADWETYLATLDTPEKFNAAFADAGDEGFKAHLKAYVQSSMGDTDLQKQISQATQQGILEMFRANEIKATGNDAALFNSALLAGKKFASNPSTAPGAKLNGVFSDVGDLVQTVWHGNRNPSAAQLKNLEIVNGYSTAVPDAGGHLVPEEFRQQLLMLELEASVVKPRATVIPMSTGTLTFPTVDATSNATSVFGGVVVYRKQEAADFVESQAKFGRVKLDLTKQTALAYVSNETIRDGGGALTAFLNQAMPQAMAFYEDAEYLTGAGAGEPLGAINANNDAMIVVAKETGQAADTIVWENVLRMYSRVLPSSIGRAVWTASPDTFFELATMALSVGTGGSAVWIMDGHGQPQLTLLGRPVIMTEKTPGVLGDQGDLSLVDFAMYLIGQGDAMSLETSPHVKFISDQTTIRVIQRNDGRPWLTSPITPKNGGPTLSPFVTLGVRS